MIGSTNPGAARDLLVVGETQDPEPGPEEVRLRVSASGINPGDVKKRQDSFGYGMPYPRIIPHSDRAGIVDRVGPGVSTTRVGERVWCYGAQSYRPFGTAAEFVVVSSMQVVAADRGPYRCFRGNTSTVGRGTRTVALGQTSQE